jgi:hypothetical protein
LVINTVRNVECFLRPLIRCLQEEANVVVTYESATFSPELR